MPVRSPTAACRRRFPALPAVLAAVLLVLGAGTHGHAAAPGRALSPAAPGSASPAAPGSASPSAAAGGSSRAGSPTAMFMPAPTQADLSDATLEVPEICALEKLPSEATQGATGTVTFSGGEAAPPPSLPEHRQSARTTIKNMTSSVLDGRPVAIATISCNYGGAYVDDAIVAYDSDLSLVATIEPRVFHADIEGRVDDVTIDAVSANAATGDLVLSMSRIGVYGDEGSHASPHSGSAKVLYTWAGRARGYTISDAVYTVGGDKKVRISRTEDVQAFVDAVIAHDDGTAAQWAAPALISALDNNAPYSGLTVRESYFPKGSTVGECRLLPPISVIGRKPEAFFDGGGSAVVEPSAPSTIVKGNSYQYEAGDIICGLGGAGSRSDEFSHWLMLRGKEDGSVEAYTPGPAGD